MSARKDSVIVTGSGGLIGSAEVNQFAEHYRVVGFDAEGPAHPPSAAECVCVDVTSEESVRDGLARVRQGYGERLSSLIHLAAYYDFSGAPSDKYEEITDTTSGYWPADWSWRRSFRARGVAGNFVDRRRRVASARSWMYFGLGRMPKGQGFGTRRCAGEFNRRGVQAGR